MTQTDPKTPTQIRTALLENGYLPIPVKGKRVRLRNWSSIQATPAAIAAWERGHADHSNTGILTGDVVAVDIDAPDAETAKALADRLMEIPGAEFALRRVGKAPKALYLFRATEPRGKAITPAYRINGAKCQVEVLGAGQQFVAYGTHPETGKPYGWGDVDPLSVPAADLPAITPEAIDAFIADADAILSVRGEPIRKPKPAQARSSAGGTFWQRVNSAALADLDRWVPALFASARKETGTGAWRVSSADLGRNLEEDISIHPDGVVDFGEEKPTTPIQLVIDYGGAATPKDAAFWLCEQLGRDPADLGWETRHPVAVTFGGGLSVPVAANDDDEDADTPDMDGTANGGLPLELCYPPGAVGEFARWITSCARFPSPHLSLVSALALTAGLVGRRYRGPTGLRSNLYIVGLAESGFGKDITLRAAEALADSTSEGNRVSGHIFADKLRSLPGLAGRLKKSPSAISVIDEFGKFLALHTGRNVPPYREEIATALMELTGAPQGSWGGQEKAAGNIPRIVQPCLTIHGVSTPSTFWGALSSGNIDEGLLGRLVVIDAGDTQPEKVRSPAGSLDDIPPGLADRVSELLGLSTGKSGNMNALNADSTNKPWPLITASYAPGVEDIFEEFDDRIRAMRTGFDPQYRPILNRVGENAARLALIVAIGCDPGDPVITREIQEWANAVAEASFYTVVRGAKANIADNEKSAEYLKVRSMIERAGSDGITLGIITKRLRGAIDKKRLLDILESLSDAREIICGEVRASSGQKKSRIWTRENVPEGMATAA